ADVIHLDIHYMNGYRDFTFDPERFPQPKRLMDTLAAHGFKVVTIVDPGLKIDSAWSVYRDGLTRGAYITTPDGAPYVAIVWPGRSVLPDFSRASVRAWWGAQPQALVDVGVRGVWNGINEPAWFGGQASAERGALLAVAAGGDARAIHAHPRHDRYTEARAVELRRRVRARESRDDPAALPDDAGVVYRVFPAHAAGQSCSSTDLLEHT